MRVALVTAVFGGYDVPKALPDGHGFDDAVLVTDVEVEVDGWRTVVEPSFLPPRLAAKRPKMLPDDYVDAPASLWLDGSFEVLDGGLRAAVDEHLSLGDLVAWRHPFRLDAYDEAAFSAEVPKYAGNADELQAQVDEYRSAGFPTGTGLWECGMLARRHTQATRLHGQAWLAQCHRWTVQDQVSFPFVCWSRGIDPVPWRGHSHWDCGWVRWHPHKDGL